MSNLRVDAYRSVALFGVAIAACLGGGCAHHAPPAAAMVEPAVPIDAFGLVIEAERWGVLIDKAGADMNAPGDEDSDLYRIDEALRSGALELVRLRDKLCASGVSPETTCVRVDLPDWVMAAPDTEATPLSTYQERSDWLGGELWPLVDAGCAAVRAETGDETACSVE